MHNHPQKLSFIEINAWASVNRVRLEPWELAAITELDDFFMEERQKPVLLVSARAKVATADHMRSLFDSIPKGKKVERKDSRPRRRKG